VSLIRKGERDLHPTGVLDRLDENDVLCQDGILVRTGGDARAQQRNDTQLTPICSSSNTLSLYMTFSLPLYGTFSNLSLTQPSSVSRDSFPRTTSFMRLLQYSFFHHSMSSARGSRFSDLGFDQSVSREPVPNLL